MKNILPNGDIEVVIDEGTQEEQRIRIKPSELMKGSLEALQTLVNEDRYGYFVWDSDEPEFEPLLIDMGTARIMVLVYEAINEKNKETFVRQIADNRGYFGRMADFAWSKATFR